MMMLNDKIDDKIEGETTTMRYHPSPFEYHKWFTVKKSVLSPRSGIGAGNGVFVERYFYKGGVILFIWEV